MPSSLQRKPVEPPAPLPPVAKAQRMTKTAEKAREADAEIQVVLRIAKTKRRAAEEVQMAEKAVTWQLVSAAE